MASTSPPTDASRPPARSSASANRPPLETRQPKQLQSLADLTATWHAVATDLLGVDASDWLRQRLGRLPTQQLLGVDEVRSQVVEHLAGTVVDVVSERRTTWRRWNLHAEASRQTAHLRMATPTDRERLVSRVVEAAESRSLALSPPDLGPVPAVLRRKDGSSRLRPAHTRIFTSADLLAAEDRLRELGGDTSGPAVGADVIRLTSSTAAQPALGDDQLAALTAVASSGRLVDLLVGPAGAGKTTALRALRSGWETRFGPDTVVGLAPSAAAAQVLAEDLGIATENTAKWLHEHRAGRTGLRAGQLVIIDEASLAGTRTLHRIAEATTSADAKVVLVGDCAQLPSVAAGGAFALLVNDRDDVAELINIRRFTQPWEQEASRRLRTGNPSALEAYTTHGRLSDGPHETMTAAAVDAWATEVAAGHETILIGASRDVVADLNTQARTRRMAGGSTQAGPTVHLADGTCAGVGDQVITRRNRRDLTAGGAWVRNGDRWTVHAVGEDGSLTLHRHRGNATVRLPATYVADNVQLGYAVTAHRAQGVTVDRSHVVVTPEMSREVLYVAMTRGRHHNTAYIITQPPADTHERPAPRNAADVLSGILSNVAAPASATRTTTDEQSRWTGLAQTVAEYQTLARLVPTATTDDRPAPDVRSRPARIAGVIPASRQPADEELRTALDQRQQLIKQHATRLTRDALEQRPEWVQALGRPPTDPVARQQWFVQVRTIAVARALYQTQPTPRLQHLARDATRHARHISQTADREAKRHTIRPPARGRSW